MSDFRETLYTVNKAGQRQWVYPRLIRGKFFRARLIVAVLLMAIYLLAPWVTIDGLQAVLLDIPARRFTFLGTTFWPTDTIYLFLLLVGLALSLFFFTALLGRIWCGWACPETVFLEFVYRPVEAFFEGSPSERRKLDAAPWSLNKVLRKSGKYFTYLALSWILASTALAYFVGHERLIVLVTGAPWHNWPLFILTVVTMALLQFQFGWFREQFCTAVCPYARFQSVLLDANSLMVGYDAKRGEPRGKLEKGPNRIKGDCIDCRLCVQVCPTGIDIRNGLQLECIQCALCADACDSVMKKIHRPIGLIRYATESALVGGTQRVMRARIALYGVLLAVIASAFTVLLEKRQMADVKVVRGKEAPYSTLQDGRISNHLQVNISNKTPSLQSYQLKLLTKGDLAMIVPVNPFPVASGQIGQVPVFFNFPKEVLKDGHLTITIEVTAGDFRQEKALPLLGPR